MSLAVFAILAALAYGGLQSVLEARAHNEAFAAELKQMQAAFLRLGEDVEQASPRPVRDGLGGVLPALTGHSGDGVVLELTRSGRTHPTEQKRSRLQRVAYRFEDGTLSRLSWAVLDQAPDSAPRAQALLGQVREMRVRFLDADGLWREDWPPPTASAAESVQMPRGLEVTIERAGWGAIPRLFRIPPGRLPPAPVGG